MNSQKTTPSIHLSCLMPNFNHGLFLKERVSSILSQLGGSDELIIIDDASTDNSVSIIKMFKNDPRLLLFQNEKNQGVVKSLNRALQKARGTYVAFMSADDRLMPDFIDKTLTVLKDHPEVALCCSDCAMSYEGFPDRSPDKIYTTRLIEEAETKQVFCADQILKIFQTTNFWIPGHTVILKKELALLYGGFDERLGFLCDWFLIHSIALNHGAAYLPEELSVWRQESTMYSRRQSKQAIATVHKQLFEILCQKPKPLRSLFRSSGLLHYYVKKRFWHLLCRPWLWDFLAVIVIRVLGRRAKRQFNQLFVYTKLKI